MLSGSVRTIDEEKTKKQGKTYQKGSGVLDIFLKSAEKCDPYVVLKCGNCAPTKSKVISNTLNPVWDQSLKCEFQAMEDTCTVSFWDEDVGSLMGDEIMGTCKFQISQLKDGKNELTLDFPEIKKLKPRVYMTVEVILKPQ